MADGRSDVRPLKVALGARESSCERQDEEERRLCDGRAVRAWCVAHRDAEGASEIEIDPVIAGSRLLDQSEAVGGAEGVASDALVRGKDHIRVCDLVRDRPCRIADADRSTSREARSDHVDQWKPPGSAEHDLHASDHPRMRSGFKPLRLPVEGEGAAGRTRETDRSTGASVDGIMGLDAMHSSLRESLLRIMDQKDHWAWPHLTRPGLSRDQLLVHFRHEYRTYVRDFPVMLARVLGQGPPPEVRRALAENIYEEQTGRLSMGSPHPELFLEMMAGLSFSRETFESESPPLEPEAVRYRELLERLAAAPPWQVGAAVLTIFVEGSKNERADMSGRRDSLPVDGAIHQHPLVVHYGCPAERMRLVRAHRMVEGGHRLDAWAMVLGNVPPDGPLAGEVVGAVEAAHRAWLEYRDGVARGMGLSR